MKNKKFSFDKLFYNNKFVFVFSLILAVAFWTAVKVNFSENTSRTLSDVKVTIDSSLAAVNDFTPFINEDELYVDVNISGKSYDISSSSFTKNNIIVEAVCGYIDSAGYKTINLTARSDDSDVTVTGIYPSSITVFFDREITDTFNVEAKLNKELSALVSGDFVVGQPVTSLSTVDVTGPATVVKNINKVYFKAEIDEKELPLTATKDFPASLVYELENERGSQFLKCDAVDDKTDPASVTIPVSAFKTVGTAVKFVNQPPKYENESPKVTIDPAKVRISYNPLEDDAGEALNVGTIDFRKLDNSVNKFKFKLDEKHAANITDEVPEFNVTVDFSALSKKIFTKIPQNIVFLNQSDNCEYEIDEKKGNLNGITIIGPYAEISKLTAEDLQIEINVSKLEPSGESSRKTAVSNISISDEFKNCWIYGDYTANVFVRNK